MYLAERAIESAPSVCRKLIVECTFRRARFSPERDKSNPVRARFALGIAAHLLQIDAKLTDSEIAAALKCDEAAAATHSAFGKRVAELSRDALDMIAQVRDDVYAHLEEVGVNVMLDEHLVEKAPVVIVPPPPSIPKVIAFVSKTLGVPELAITGLSHKGREVDARHIAIAVSQTLWPDRSRPLIGSYFSGRDSATVRHALKRVDAVIRGEKDDVDLLNKIELVCQRLGWETSKLHYVEKQKC